MQGKPASIGKMTLTHWPLPEEANPTGNLYGGNIMRHMDSVGGVCAMRWTRDKVVTAGIEFMSFLTPVKPGEIMLFHAAVNAVWNTSMEVGIRTEAEDPFTGDRRHVCTCYMTFVGVDEGGRPKPLPPLVPETDEDRRRMADATRRMALSRMEHKHEGSAMSALSLRIMPGSFAVCRLPADAAWPDRSLLPCSEFISISHTEDELSIVMPENAARALAATRPDMQLMPGFKCLKLLGSDFLYAIGTLAGLTTLLASVQVPVVTVSTYGGCYVLLEEQLLDKATERLQNAGHILSCDRQPPGCS